MPLLSVARYHEDEPSQPDHNQYRVAGVRYARPDEVYFDHDHEGHDPLQGALHRSAPPSDRRSRSSSMHLFCAVDMAFRATPENAVSSGPDPQATGLEISC